MVQLLTALRRSRAADFVSLAGKLVGVGLFVALIYNYCTVLLEACFRHVR